MLTDNVLARDLDEFSSVPVYKENIMVQPSRLHRAVYGGILLVAVLLAITGIANFYAVFSHTDHPVSDTGTLAIGLILILIAGGLIWRFASPFVFAVAATANGLSWRTLFGWRSVAWDEVDFALIQPHTAYGGREVHLRAEKSRLHFGWFDSTDWYSFGPLESLPSDEAKRIVHTIVQRASLQRREAGVWVRNGDKKIVVDTGQFRW